MKPRDDNWLDEKLAPLPPHPNRDHLRQRVLGDTLKTFRRRVRHRRLLLAAGFLLCYLAGLFTWQLINRPHSPAPQPSLADRSSPPPETAPAPASESARDLEWQAVEKADRNPRLFRAAGDRYLKEEIDPLSAVRCYRQALDEEPEGALTVSPEDSWLLMAIKHARKKEKDDATPGI